MSEEVIFPTRKGSEQAIVNRRMSAWHGCLLGCCKLALYFDAELPQYKDNKINRYLCSVTDIGLKAGEPRSMASNSRQLPV